METLSLIYIIKILLGVLAAIICILLDIKDIISGAGIGIIVYLASDKILRQIFIEKVEKPSVVTKTGIGMYIITWLFVWILLCTLIQSLA